MSAPKFFTIESTVFPGYNLTQRGSTVVLAAANTDNPFQLWYKDDSWIFVTDLYTKSPPFVLLNNGSKKALKAVLESDSSGRPRATKVGLATYDPSVEEIELFWTFSGELATATVLPASSSNSNLTVGLGVGQTKPASGNGISVIVSTQASSKTQWKFNEFAPPAFKIVVNWYTQVLTYKIPHQDYTWVNVSGTKNDEWNLAIVNSANKTDDKQVWYRVPAGGLEDSNSSFIIINKSSGKALKGSGKAGDKVIATEYDPLDNNFVWSEDRLVTNNQTFIGVDLSTNPQLRWYVTSDAEYQNASWYHTLTLRGDNVGGAQFLWKFDTDLS